MHWRLVAALTAALLCVVPRVSSLPVPSGPLGDRPTAALPDSQHTPPDQPSPGPPPRIRLQLWYGHSARPVRLLGTISDSRLRLLGLRLYRRLLPTSAQLADGYDAPTLTYTADLIPFASVHIPESAAPSAYFSQGSGALSTNGIGLYPVGLQVGFRPVTRVRPFLAGHTGVLYFFDPVPDERGKQLNFAVGIGGGVEVSIGSRTTLALTYRYHHISNGFRGSINPGLDANVLYLGVGVAL